MINEYEKTQTVKNRFLIKALLLSRFDDILGPIIKYSTPHLDRENIRALQVVPRLMDLMEQGPFFTHNAHNIFTANYFFTMPTFGVRGSMEQVLITIVFRFREVDEALSSKILVFLHQHRSMLERMASILRDNPNFKKNGLFSPKNETELKGIMQSFYTSIFIEDARNLFAADPSNTTIWVMTQNSIDGPEILDRLRFTLQTLPRKTMRDEITLFMLNRLNFETFNCTERYDGLIGCPSCEKKYHDASAYIYIFNVENTSALEDLEQIIKHINALGKKNDKLFLILGIISSDEIEVEGFTFRTKAQAYHKIANVQFSRNCRLAIVDINDIDTYFDPVRWLIVDAL